MKNREGVDEGKKRKKRSEGMKEREGNKRGVKDTKKGMREGGEM